MTSTVATSAADPRDPSGPASGGEPPVEEPNETAPTREEPGTVDPSPSEAPMVA